MKTARTRRNTRRRCAAAACFCVLASTAAASPDLDWLDREAIAAGDVLVQTEHGERPQIVRVKVAAIVHSGPRPIWDILRACQIAPEYVPNVVACHSLEVVDGGKAELFVQTVKPAFFIPAFEHVFRLDYTPYTRIDVHRVSGPIDYMEGTWWLIPEEGDRTLLVYELGVDPGIPIPRFFVRATMKRDLPRILEAVRTRAETADGAQ